MQQTPSDFFRAQEENYQHSMTQEDPHDLELSDSHQNMQETQVTDQNSHEQLQLSAETHQHFASSNLHEYQQSPVTDQIRHHQLQLSVEVYQSTVHNFHSMLPNPPNFQENQQLPGTEQSLYDQLDKTIQNHQQMLQTPANIEGCQHLLAFDDTFQWLLDSSDDNLSFDINGILNEG